MRTFLVVLGLAAFAVLCGTLLYLQRRRANTLLEAWAADNRFTILSRRFSWNDDDDCVCRVVIRDELGRERTGSVRFGRFGTRTVSVRWRD